MGAVTVLRWVATVLLAVFVVFSIARGEVKFGGPRTSIRRQEKPSPSGPLSAWAWS